jgi:hypothetical protein
MEISAFPARSSDARREGEAERPSMARRAVDSSRRTSMSMGSSM